MLFPESCLRVSGLTCDRGFKRLFSDMSFSLNSGEIIHLQGPNGSGKSTLLRGISGLFPFSSGEIHWNGQSITRQWSGFVSNLAYLGHKISIKESLTARENLHFVIQIRGIQPAMTIDEALGILKIQSCADIPAFQLSAGQKQRLSLARVLISDAPLWLLDEPGSALDDEGIDILEKLMNEHISDNGSILYAGHQRLNLSADNFTIPL